MFVSWLPDVARKPVQLASRAGETLAVQLDKLPTPVQVIVPCCPERMVTPLLSPLTLRSIAPTGGGGGAAVTVTVALAFAVPPGPVHEIVNVVV
jgi:hypothetical protein